MCLASLLSAPSCHGFNAVSNKLRAVVNETRKELHELRNQLGDLLEFFEAMRGAFKVLNWLGKLAKPAAAIVGLGAACITAWTAWRGVR